MAEIGRGTRENALVMPSGPNKKRSSAPIMTEQEKAKHKEIIAKLLEDCDKISSKTGKKI